MPSGRYFALDFVGIMFFQTFKITSLCDQNSGHPMGFQALLREHDDLIYIINTYELTVCLLGTIPQRIVKLLPKLERCPDLNSIRVEIRPGLSWNSNHQTIRVKIMVNIFGVWQWCWLHFLCRNSSTMFFFCVPIHGSAENFEKTEKGRGVWRTFSLKGYCNESVLCPMDPVNICQSLACISHFDHLDIRQILGNKKNTLFFLRWIFYRYETTTNTTKGVLPLLLPGHAWWVALPGVESVQEGPSRWAPSRVISRVK